MESCDILFDLATKLQNFNFKSSSFIPATPWSGKSTVSHIFEISKNRKTKKKMSDQNEMLHRLQLWINISTITSQDRANSDTVSGVTSHSGINENLKDCVKLNHGIERSDKQTPDLLLSPSDPKQSVSSKNKDDDNRPHQVQEKITFLKSIFSEKLAPMVPKPPKSPLMRQKGGKRPIIRNKRQQAPLIRGCERSSILLRGNKMFGKKKSLTQRGSFFRRPSVALPTRFDVTTLLRNCKVRTSAEMKSLRRCTFSISSFRRRRTSLGAGSIRRFASVRKSPITKYDAWNRYISNNNHNNGNHNNNNNNNNHNNNNNNNNNNHNNNNNNKNDDIEQSKNKIGNNNPLKNQSKNNHHFNNNNNKDSNIKNNNRTMNTIDNIIQNENHQTQNDIKITSSSSSRTKAFDEVFPHKGGHMNLGRDNIRKLCLRLNSLPDTISNGRASPRNDQVQNPVMASLQEDVLMVPRVAKKSSNLRRRKPPVQRSKSLVEEVDDSKQNVNLKRLFSVQVKNEDYGRSNTRDHCVRHDGENIIFV